MPSPGKASCNSHATQPTAHAGCFSVSIIHRTLTWATGSLTCTQMLMHVIARRGVWTHIRESALKVESGTKYPLPPRGIEPASAACRSDTLPTELHPFLQETEERVRRGENEFKLLPRCTSKPLSYVCSPPIQDQAQLVVSLLQRRCGQHDTVACRLYVTMSGKQ